MAFSDIIIIGRCYVFIFIISNKCRNIENCRKKIKKDVKSPFILYFKNIVLTYSCNYRASYIC